MTHHTLEPFLDTLLFPEGLRWHQGELWFSDFLLRRVFSATPAGRLTQRAFVPGQPSGLGFAPDGRVLVASMYDRNVVAVDAQQHLKCVAHVGNVVKGQINDMVVDSKGRAYISNFGYDAMYEGMNPAITTGLAYVDETGKPSVKGEGLRMPNGVALSADGKLLVVAETTALRLTAFDVAPDGSLTNQRVFATLSERPPDGICFDAEGAVWVACFTAKEFVRVLDGGEITDTATIPSGWATACALGGVDGRTLYCAIAETDLDRIHQGDSKGRIATARVAVPGIGL